MKSRDSKKRKIDDSSTNENMDTKTTETSVRTKAMHEITGKSLRKALNSPSDALESLKKLISPSKSKTGKDLALEYLEAGGSVIEILKILEKSDKKNLSASTTVLSAMHTIIMKIVAECPQYHQSAGEACRYFINSHLSSVHSLLSSQSNPKQRKVVLRLLTSIVALGDNLPCELLAHLSFHDQTAQFLAQQTAPTDPESVRTCFIHFIVAFLVDGTTAVTRALLDKRGLLASIFPDLIYDTHTTVNLVLTTVKSYVLENPSVSKTTKMHIFSTEVTQSLVNLYNWKGPKAWPGLNKKAKIDVEIDASHKEVAVDAVHDFLTLLLTSHRHGVIFNDRSLGTSRRQYNQLANSVLHNLDRPWEHAKPCDLVVKILSACPDLIKPQFKALESFLEPRESSKWLSVMAFVQNVIKSVNPETCLKPCLSELTQTQLISATINLTMSPIVLKTAISPCFKSSSVLLLHNAVETLQTMLHQVNEFFSTIENYYQAGEFLKYKSTICDYISKNIPGIGEILEAWNNARDAEESDKFVDQAPTSAENFSSVLNLIQTILDIHPDILNVSMELKISPMVLMEGLKAFDEEDSDLMTEYTIKAMQIIYALDSNAFHSDGDFFNESLVFLISLLSNEKPAVESAAKKTIKMIMTTTNVFDSSQDHLDIWLNCFTLFETLAARMDLASWFMDVIQRTKKRMGHFLSIVIDAEKNSSNSIVTIDQTQAIINELYELESDNEEKSSDTKNPLISDENSEEKIEIFDLQISSNIPSIFYSAVEELKEKPSENAAIYMSYVIIFTLHCQINYQKLIEITDDIECLQSKYLINWKIGKVCAVKKPFSSTSLICKFSKMLLNDVDINFQEIFQGSEEIKVIFDGEEIIFKYSLNHFEVIMLLRMTLFYVTQFLRMNQMTKVQFDRFVKVIIVLLDIAHDLNQKFKLNNTKNCLKMITCNPIIFEHFSPFDKKKNIIKNIVTDGLIKIFHKMIEITEKKNILNELFSKHRDKFLLRLKFIIPKLQSPWEIQSSNHLEFLEILQLSKENIFILLKQISGLPTNLLLTPGKKSLTFAGVLGAKLIELLAMKNDEKDFDDDKILVDDLSNVISKIMSHFWLLKSIAQVDLDIWEVAVHKYLLKHPHHIAKINLKHFSRLFNRSPNASTVKLASFLINQNSKLIPQFINVVSTNPKYLQNTDVIFEIISNNLSSIWDEKFLQKIYNSHKNNIVNYFSFSSENNEYFDDFPEVICYLIQSCMDLKTSQNIIEIILSNGDKLENVNLIFIKLLECLFNKHAKMHENKIEIFKNWIQVLIRLLVCALKKSLKTEDKLEILCDYSLNALKKLKLNDIIFDEIFKNNSWPQFLRFTLKNGLKLNSENNKSKVLKIFAEFCDIAYKDKCEDEQVKIIFEMATSHSDFINFMLSDGEKKKNLLELLSVLIKKNNSLMVSSHIPLYLSAYGGTLSDSDQLILRILQQYEDFGVKLSEYRPYLWGKAAASYYSIKGERDSALWRHPDALKILELFNEDTVKITIKDFPILRTNNCTEIFYTDNKDQIYDPVFYLPLLNNLLAENNVVPCLKVTQSGALGLIFAASASSCVEIRLAALTALSKFYFHLESTSYKEKLLWMRFIDAFRNGIVELELPLKDVRLSYLVTNFLAKAAIISSQPLHPLYAPLQAFMMAKPAMDLNVIPEFHTFFHSSDTNHLIHKHWILEVIRDGLKTDVDMKVAWKCVLFRMLFTFYDSILADDESKNLILEISKVASKISRKKHFFELISDV